LGYSISQKENSKLKSFLFLCIFSLTLTQDKSMKTLILILLIIFMIIAVLNYPFRIRGTFHVDVLNNIGFAVFKVLFIRLLSEKFKLSKSGKIEVEKEKNKKRKKNKILINKYFKCLSERSHVRRVDLFFDAGSKENVFFVSMLSGYVGVITSSISAVLINKYKDIKLFNSFKPSYNKDKLEVTGDLIASFSLKDMITSFICAVIYYFKKKKERKNV